MGLVEEVTFLRFYFFEFQMLPIVFITIGFYPDSNHLKKNLYK